VGDSELKYPSWQTPLHQAMLEVDSEKLARKILEVEALICARLLEMASDTDHRDEREVLAGAATILRVLKEGEF